MGDSRPQVTREQIERERDLIMAAWMARAEWARTTLSFADESAALQACLDANVGPLPAPEPQQAVGPSGTSYMLREVAGALWATRDRASSPDSGCLSLPPEDRATVANLLCPFEDVVRATLEEMEVVQVVMERVGSARYYGSEHPLKDWNGFADKMTAGLPAILKRLEGR